MEEANCLDFIPTRSSILSNDVKNNFEAITFTSYKKKAKKQDAPSVKLQNSEDNTTFNVKKARYEILKFGMSGFDQHKKQEAKTKLAIKLGAKPPKNKYKNYKQLLDDKKKEKEIRDNNLKFQQLGKDPRGKSLAKNKKFDHKRRILKGSLLEAYGTVKATTSSK